jgi:UDP-N-acetylmuramoylalanine--D-glutamate ligase
MLDEFRDINAVVVGLGRSGIAATRLLHFLGSKVKATDSRILNTKSLNLPEDVVIETGGHSKEILDGAELVVISPGVPPWIEIIKEAENRGVEVISEIELAYRCTEEFEVPWIGITGTNGKSTTTTLVEMMMRRQGLKIIAGGNIGTPMTELVLEMLLTKTQRSSDFLVAELSSFQLEKIKRFHSHISTILNITPDHQDRYSDIREYLGAKMKIFQNQGKEDYLVLNSDQPVIKDLCRECTSEVFYFSRRGPVKGVYLEDNYIVLNRDGKPIPLINTSQMGLKGVHNIENAMVASLIAYLCGVSPENITAVLKEFRGLPHRMEFVAEIDGISFYNDSKGTNIDAVIKSVEGFRCPVILILGGRDKGADFSILGMFRRTIRKVICIGEAKDKIKAQLSGVLPTEDASDMDEAVQKAFTAASGGGVVLLSPGCASFDMFQNFEERGEAFKRAVKELESVTRK